MFYFKIQFNLTLIFEQKKEDDISHLLLCRLKASQTTFLQQMPDMPLLRLLPPPTLCGVPARGGLYMCGRREATSDSVLRATLCQQNCRYLHVCLSHVQFYFFYFSSFFSSPLKFYFFRKSFTSLYEYIIVYFLYIVNIYFNSFLNFFRHKKRARRLSNRN